MTMHVVVVANGTIADQKSARGIARDADLLLCADGGASHVLSWGLEPDMVIGDMDSLTDDELDRLEAHNVHLMRYAARKNETDLELALEQAIRRGATEITILGALGGRLDHTLANILLLAWPRLGPLRVSIVDGREQLFLIRQSMTIEGRPGDIVSLIPLSSEVTGITTSGLEYPLRGETLYMGPSRGVSNVLTARQATITLEGGLLLAVHHAMET